MFNLATHIPCLGIPQSGKEKVIGDTHRLSRIGCLSHLKLDIGPLFIFEAPRELFR